MTSAAGHAAGGLSSLGKYRLIASLGQGGMAKVYLALMAGPAGFNKLLVIKALREDMLAASDEFVAMFLDEARLAARLNHPNVVQTYEVGETGGRYFIAMEYLEGQSLRTVQRRLSPKGLPREEELRVLAETARGLHYAHELRGFDGGTLNVVHRDVSPQNVFLTYDGQVKLLDFGIAKTCDAHHRTKVGVIKGKVDYIAPEQIRGDTIDRRADVFALGAMMWEALSGQRFGGGPAVVEVTKIHNRATGREPKLAQVAPKTPRALIKICERALALDVERRFPTAEDFANELDAYLAGTKYRASNKTLAAIMAEPFESERAKLRALIDEQIRLVAHRPLHYSGSPSGPVGTSSPALTRSARAQSGVRPRRHSIDGELPDLSVLTNGGTPTNLETSDLPPRSGTFSAITVFFIMITVVAVTLWGTQGETALDMTQPALISPRVEPLEATPVPPTPKVTPLPMETVRVHVDVTPEGAVATLDGARLPRLPFDADLARDGRLHTLEVHAPDHETLTQVLTFERDQHLSLTLKERTRASGRMAKRRARPSGAPAEDETPALSLEEFGARHAVPKKQQPASSANRPRRLTPVTTEEIKPGEDLLPDTGSRELPKIDTDDPYQ